MNHTGSRNNHNIDTVVRSIEMEANAVVAEDRILNFGKFRNKYLSKVPETYLKWIISHSKVLAVRNRHYAVLAQKLLEAREAAKAQAEAIKELEEKHEGNADWHKALKSSAKSNDIGVLGSLHSAKAFSLMR